MSLADKFTCDVPAEGSSFIECAVPEPGVLEWMTAIGTLGATIVALGVGMASWFGQKLSENKADRIRKEASDDMAREDHRRNQENQFALVVDMMKQMVESFPFGSRESQLWFQTQFRTYLRFLNDDPNNEELASGAEQVLQLFGLINFSYTAETNSDSEEYQKFWADEIIVVESKGLLMMLAAQFESSLKYWHRTGEQKNIAEAGLVFLHSTVQDRFDEIEKEHKL